MDFLKGKAAIVGCFPCLVNWIHCKDILLAVMVMFYGDAAYPLRPLLQEPFWGAVLTPEQQAWSAISLWVKFVYLLNGYFSHYKLF